MDRRSFLQLAALGSGQRSIASPAADGRPRALSDLKITRIRVFNPTDKTDLSGFPEPRQHLRCGRHRCRHHRSSGRLARFAPVPGGRLIGETVPDRVPLAADVPRLDLSRGQRALAAVGALDCALWDIKERGRSTRPYFSCSAGKARVTTSSVITRSALLAPKGQAKQGRAQGDGGRLPRDSYPRRAGERAACSTRGGRSTRSSRSRRALREGVGPTATSS